jgi:hypothetical protein
MNKFPQWLGIFTKNYLTKNLPKKVIPSIEIETLYAHQIQKLESSPSQQKQKR